ncbi:hypothetical protein K502DRAFT_70398 [Neoconidiobolus thromboides FSU 785]|nr:hypothetical protein K502DRAFT_70398 [Neoconidiobolus thromboides FSU 785]
MNSSDDYHCLELCSNTASLCISFEGGLKELDVLLASNLYPKLKKLSIYIPYDEYEKFVSCLPQFKQMLDDIEFLSINSVSVNTNEFINYLNPNKLKSLELHSDYNADSSTLTKIKDKLPLLKLSIVSYDDDEMNYGFDYLIYGDVFLYLRILLTNFPLK